MSGKAALNPRSASFKPSTPDPLARKGHLFDHVFPEELAGRIDVPPVQNPLNQLENNAAVGLHDLFPWNELLTIGFGRPSFWLSGGTVRPEHHERMTRK